MKPYKDTVVRAMYEQAPDGRILVSRSEFEELIGYVRGHPEPVPIRGVYDEHKVSGEVRERLNEAGFLPVSGDVRAVIAFRSEDK